MKTLFTLVATILLTFSFAFGQKAQKSTSAAATPKTVFSVSTLYFAGTVTSVGETMFVVPGTIKPSSNEQENRILITRAGRVRSIMFRAEGTTFANVTLRRNGIDTGLATNFAGGLGVYEAKTFDGVNVVPGDFITVAIFSPNGVTITSLSIDIEQ